MDDSEDAKKLRESALKLLKLLIRVTTRNFVRTALEELELEMAWAPARFGGTGPCFAARETSGMLQMISRLRNAWPSHPRAANVRQ